MRLTITNDDQLTRWMGERRRKHGDNLDLRAIKGPAPEGACYNDGTPIKLPVNIAWKDMGTGEVFAIEYALDGDTP